MCIIIQKPAKKKLDEEVYKNCFDKNNDGAGISYVNDKGEMVVDKGFFSFKEFYDAVKANEHREMIIHCRISTAGLVNEDNCHPFLIVPKKQNRFSFAVAHNGHLPWRSTKNASDTNCFVNDILAPLFETDPWFLDRPHGFWLIEGFIGTNNKIVVMRHDNEPSVKEKDRIKTYIINEKAGNTKHGCWFSNYSYVGFKKQEYAYHSPYMGGSIVDSHEYGPLRGLLLLNQDDHEKYGWVEGDAPMGGRRFFAVDSKEGKALVEKKRAEKAKTNVVQLQLPHSKTATTNPIIIPDNVDMSKVDAFLKGVKQDQKAEKDMLDAAEAHSDSINSPTEQEVEDATHLNHLDKQKKRDMRRMAADYFKENLNGSSGFSNAEMIIWLRDVFREAHSPLKALDDVKCDQWVLDPANAEIVQSILHPLIVEEVEQ